MNANRRKAFRTIADVLRSPIAELAALRRKPVQKTDRVMRSGKLEDSIYAELREDDAEMDLTENAAAQKLKSFPALSRDVFQSLYSLAPRRNDADMLTAAAQKFNAPILDHISQQDDYPTLKNICEGRSLPAYEAAAEFTGRAAEELDGLLSELGGDKGALNTLEELETARDAAAEELAKLLDAQATGETTETDKQALINAANRLNSKQRQVEAVSQMLDTTMLRQTETVDLAVSAAVQAATERAQEVQSIIGAWSDEPMNMCRTPENLALLEKVRQSTALKDISKYLGRFREIFTQAKKNSYAYGRGETYSLELGNNLSRALTSELAMLATSETIPLFLRKYQQKQIKQYRRREPIYKGMGDIICCLDESGSTEGEAAAWGKAVAMTLLEIAAESHRSFALIHFAGSSSCQVDIFRPGEYTLEDKLSAAETFLGGGTNFERPIREAIRLMESEDFEKADVVFITDGACELSDAYQQELQAAQVAYHFTVTGILLDKGQADMDFSLKPFCQKIYRTSELAGDTIVRFMISSQA